VVFSAKTAITLWVPQSAVNFLIGWETITFSRRIFLYGVSQLPSYDIHNSHLFGLIKTKKFYNSNNKRTSCIVLIVCSEDVFIMYFVRNKSSCWNLHIV
jgi:hypothetical protein